MIKKIIITISIACSLIAGSCNNSKNDKNYSLPKKSNDIQDYRYSNFSYGVNDINTVMKDFKNNKKLNKIDIKIHTLRESSFNKKIIQKVNELFYKKVNISFVDEKQDNGFVLPYIEIKSKNYIPNIDKILVKKDNKYILTNYMLRKYYHIVDSYFYKEVKPNNNQKADVNLYIMSLCPYGLAAEKSLINRVEHNQINIDKININYIISKKRYGYYSLHGDKEIDEDVRQLYIKDKFGMKILFKYLKVFINTKGNYNLALKKINLTDEEIFRNWNKVYSFLFFEGLKTLKNNINASPTYVDNFGKKINIEGF